ncbi:hypothetical protein F5148DRAFT_1176084 [Russula earlei]|uniref:Uncharacterized protein n=1 Tax=Russula earlei TaxID=71964 RepID=A0ACC0UHV0_9AGAM|nr:hypothetical protein F5148DRAFT_1176084 [Russula earlei]
MSHHDIMIRHMYSPPYPDPRWWGCHSIKLVPAVTILSSCAPTHHHSRLTGTGYLQSRLFLPCFASLVASFHRSHVPQRTPTSSSSVSPLKLTLRCRKERFPPLEEMDLPTRQKIYNQKLRYLNDNRHLLSSHDYGKEMDYLNSIMALKRAALNDPKTNADATTTRGVKG